MKRIILLFPFIILLFLTGCSKESVSSPSAMTGKEMTDITALFTGIWEIDEPDVPIEYISLEIDNKKELIYSKASSIEELPKSKETLLFSELSDKSLFLLTTDNEAQLNFYFDDQNILRHYISTNDPNARGTSAPYKYKRVSSD